MTVLSTGSGAPLNDCSEPRGRGQDVAGSDLTASAVGARWFHYWYGVGCRCGSVGIHD